MITGTSDLEGGIKWLSVPAVQELIARLGKVIMDRFTAGETDPERLKAIAIESIQRP